MDAISGSGAPAPSDHPGENGADPGENPKAEAVAFGDREREILEFERFWWKYAGAKERAIKENLQMSATRYYQQLNAIIDLPGALGYDPILVKRLQRLRAFRQRERVARRLGVQHQPQASG